MSQTDPLRAPDLPLYLQLAETIERAIHQRKYGLGEQLPAIRRLSELHGVSINTVKNALEQLKDKGLLQVQNRAGYYVNRPDLPQNVPLASFIAKPRQLNLQESWEEEISAIAQGDAHPLGPMLNQTNSSARKAYLRCLQQALKKENSESRKDQRLTRQALQSYYQRRKLRRPAAEILLTTSTTTALHNCLSVLLKRGDTVLIPAPSHPGHLAMLAQFGMKVLEIPMTADGPDREQMRHWFASGELRLAIVNPVSHNPTGISFTEACKKEIAALANRHAVIVIEDDVTAFYQYDEKFPRTISSYDHSGWVLTIGSMSKLLGGNTTIGWCFAGRFQEQLQRQINISSSLPNAFSVTATAQFLTSRRFEYYWNQQRKICYSSTHEAIDFLQQHLPAGCHIQPPHGGSLLWLTLDNKAFALNKLPDEFRAHGLYPYFGEMFSFGTQYRHCLRLALFGDAKLNQQHLQLFCDVLHKNQRAANKA